MLSKTLRNIAFSLMGTILLVLIGATFVEQLYGTDIAVQYIYTAPWTIVLWAAACFFGVWYLWRQYPLSNSPQGVHYPSSVFFIHLSFVIILTGAFVTHLWGVTGAVHMRIGETTSTYQTPDGEANELPFSLTLTDFQVEYYPGTATAADYVSTLSIDSTNAVVSMNNIARHAGWRFYQSSYDEDAGGSTLLVSHDPWGIGITYAGYLLLLVSFLAYLLSPTTVKRSTGAADLQGSARSTAKRSITLLLLVLGSASASAAPKAPQRPVANSFGNLYVEYNGRICPMSTLATDVCNKLYGKSYYMAEDGTRYTANQVLSGILFYYDDWAEVPLKQSRKAQQNSERKTIFQMVANGSMFKIWYSPDGWRDINNPISSTGAADLQRSDLPSDSANALEWQFRMYALQYVAYDLMQGKNISANNTLQKIRAYQQKTSVGLPTERHFRAEQLFKAFPYSKPLAMACITIGLLFFLLSCIYRAKGKELPRWSQVLLSIVTCLVWLFLTAMLAWRWYVSGHIPMTNGHETMQTMAWLTLLVGIFLPMFAWNKEQRTKNKDKTATTDQTTHIGHGSLFLTPYSNAVSCLLIASFALLVSMMTASNPQITHIMPVLQSPLLSIHVTIIMLSYALFAFMMMNGVMGLFMSSNEQQRLAALNFRLLPPAVACLAIGIFIGAVWANISWGRYWGWDPKEVWAVITLMVYALPLHRRSLPAFQRPRFFLVYSIVAFAAVLFTYFGVNFLLGGMHAYA